MSGAPTLGPAAREGTLTAQLPVLALLLALSGLAWLGTALMSMGDMRLGLLTGGGGSGTEGMAGMGSAAAGGAAPMGLVLFLATWTVMMVAMMFPAMSPVVATFDRWVRRSGRSRGATAAFVVGYLVVWGVTGAAVYGLLAALQAWLPAGDDRAVRAGALILLAAGLYQLTPLKSACLEHCRSPLAFMAHHGPALTRGGLGPLRVGGRHGLFCVGCCWSLMLVLVLLGLMNLAWMAAVAVVVVLEKLARGGVLISRAVGIALVVVGVVLFVEPTTLPSLT